jgi:excisionase family DNA binding protein
VSAQGIEKKFLGTHEVARLLSVDAGTVIRWADAGRLPCFRTPGGHRRISKDDVLRFVREHHWPWPEPSQGGTL